MSANISGGGDSASYTIQGQFKLDGEKLNPL